MLDSWNRTPFRALTGRPYDKPLCPFLFFGRPKTVKENVNNLGFEISFPIMRGAVELPRVSEAAIDYPHRRTNVRVALNRQKRRYLTRIFHPRAFFRFGLIEAARR